MRLAASRAMPLRHIENKVDRRPIDAGSSSRAVHEVIQKMQSAAELHGFVTGPPEDAAQGFDGFFAVVLLKAVVGLILFQPEIGPQIVCNADADNVLLPSVT